MNEVGEPLDLERLWERSMRSSRCFDEIAKRTARVLDEFWIRGLVILTERPHKLGNYRVHVAGGDIEHRIFVKEAEATS